MNELDLNIPYFVYGTLRPFGWNHSIVEDSVKSVADGRASAPFYGLISNTRLPFAVPIGHLRDEFPQIHCATGALLYPNAGKRGAVMKALDELEGHPHFYKRIPTQVCVWGEDNETLLRRTAAWIYQLADHGNFRSSSTPIMSGDYYKEDEWALTQYTQ